MPNFTPETLQQHYKNVAIRFYMHPTGKLNKRRSEEEGFPVYEDIEKVEIRQAGDQKQIAHFNADDPSDWVDPVTGIHMAYKEIFARQYEQFVSKKAQIGDGTAIEILPDLTGAQVSTLKAVGCHTIEALANMDGPNLKTLGMFGRDLKAKAENWLDKRGAFGTAKDMQEQIDMLKAQNEQLMAMHQGDKMPKENKTQGKPVTDGVVATTPFDDWTVDTIAVYIADNGGNLPKSRKKSEMVAEAMRLADENQKANAA